MNDKALVLLSGGQDSATALLWAINNFKDVECISFDYRQMHSKELYCSKAICELLHIIRIVIDLDFVEDIAISSLLTPLVNGQHPINKNLPSSFLPGRNILFLTIAGMYAYTNGIHNLIGGMCQTDYSGYPDCRVPFISYMEKALTSGLDYYIKIITPLMYMTKAEEVKLAFSLPYGPEVLALTHTCYKGEYPPCGECPACILRAKGFSEANIKDPIFGG